MHGQARFKKNMNLESRLRTVRYLGELTKFRVAPPMVVLRGLRRCLEDFSGANIDVACCLLESCGRYLYRMKHTHSRLEGLMDTMMRIKKARVRESTQFIFSCAFPEFIFIQSGLEGVSNTCFSAREPTHYDRILMNDTWP